MNTRDRWFRESMTVDQVKRRSVLGVATTAFRQFATQAIRLGSLVFLARMLTPNDFGLIAMITAIMGVASVLVDIELSTVTIRFDKLTHQQASNLFWFRIVNAVLLIGLVLMVSGVVQDFYGDMRVQQVMLALSPGILLTALAKQHSALLHRNLRVREIAQVEILVVAMTAAISLLLTYYDYGYWALVVGALAGGATGLLLNWNLCDWRPSLPVRGVGIRALIVDGLRLSTFTIMAFVAGNLSQIIIGKAWGATSVGQYTRASNLYNLLLGNAWGAIDVVAGPSMAKLRNDPQRLANYYYKVSALTTMVGMPLMFTGLFLPRELIFVLFGTQWVESVDVLRLLALGVIPAIICHTSGWVYFSIGSSIGIMWWGLIGWSGVIVGTLIGSLYGPKGIALAASVTVTLLTVPCMLIAFRGTPLKLLALCRMLWPSLLAAFISCGVAWLCLDALPLQSDLSRLIFGGTLFVLVYGTLLMTLFGQRRLIMDVLSQFRSMPRAA